MTTPDPTQALDLGMGYGELLDHLRKDLQLDARTDIAPGTVLALLQPVKPAAPVTLADVIAIIRGVGLSQ
jgi:hypothetical protein